MRYRVRNVTRKTWLADDMREARRFLERLRGLMGRKDFPMGSALHIAPCSSIHTFFMRIPIDVLFLDAQLRVVDAVDALPPWRASKLYFDARSTLELPAGTIRASLTQAGDELAFETAPEPFQALTDSGRVA